MTAEEEPVISGTLTDEITYEEIGRLQDALNEAGLSEVSRSSTFAASPASTRKNPAAPLRSDAEPDYADGQVETGNSRKPFPTC